MAMDIKTILATDPRYKLEAYTFVLDGLSYAFNVLDMGLCDTTTGNAEEEDDEPPSEANRSLTCHQLCEALRRYAIFQFGLLARSVLKCWGVESTYDFGQIVENLVLCDQITFTEKDTIEEFNDVYDFESAFEEETF